MKNNVRAYKVCRLKDGVTDSAVKSRRMSPQSVVRYEFGKLVKPQDNPHTEPFLFVFKTLADAQRFILRRSMGREFVVYEVRAFSVKDSWHSKIWGRILLASNFPLGTMFCSSLRLVRAVGKARGSQQLEPAQRAYKVCSVEPNGDYMSSTLGNELTYIKYDLGKMVTAMPTAPRKELFVFDDLGEAAEFAGNNPRPRVVFEVDIFGMSKTMVKPVVHDLPKGTIFCQSLLMVKEV